MKVITEKDAIIARNALLKKGNNLGACAIDMLISDHLQEIDTLTVNETDLILAAEKYTEVYDGDGRQDVKTDALNAFYHGAKWQKKHKPELTGDGE